MNGKVNILKFFFGTGENTNATSMMDKITNFFPAVIYIYDVENKRFQYINQKFTDYFGFKLEEIVESESPLFDVVFKDDVDVDRIKKELDNFYSLQDDKSHCFDCRLMHREGNWRYFKTSGTVLSRNADGKAASLLFVAQDITDELKSKEEVDALKALFKETEDQLKYGSWSLDLKSDNMTWTQGMYNVFGYSPEEVKSIDSDFYLSHVIPEDREVLKTQIAIAQKDKSDFVQEYSIETKAGEHKRVSTTAKIVEEKRGEINKIIGITRDLTEIKNYEKDQERTLRELNRSNKELEEFAYIASHDLQEPLRKISMFTERLRSKYSGSFDKEGELYLDRVLASANNMRTLMDNLLEFSRANRSSSGFVSVNLKTIVDQVAGELELKIEETNSKIIFKSALPEIEAVPTEMKQLFNNLIANAIKFKKEDTESVIEISAARLTTDDKRKMHLPLDKTFHAIQVMDNGIGFEEEYAERIFQIFQRLHGKAEYPGSGIGLAICKKIVDNHNGVIFAQSEPGEGATFTIILPENQF